MQLNITLNFANQGKCKNELEVIETIIDAVTHLLDNVSANYPQKITAQEFASALESQSVSACVTATINLMRDPDYFGENSHGQ